MKKVDVSRQERNTIVNLYTEQNKTIMEISIIFENYSRRVINRVLREEGITKRAKGRMRYSVWQHAKEVIDCYEVKKMSFARIAKAFNTSESTVRCILKEYSIQSRSLSEARKYRPDKWGSVNTTNERAVELRGKNMKIQEIAEILRITTPEVLQILREENALVNPGQNTFG